MLLTWDAEFETRTSELYLAVVNESQAKVMRLSADDGFASTFPDVQPWYTTAILSWQDARHGASEIYLAAVSLGLVQAGTPEAQFQATTLRLTRAREDAAGAYLARNGQHLALGFNTAVNGNQEVHVLSIYPEGDRLVFSPAVQLSHTATDSLVPAIQPLADGFVLAWNEADLRQVDPGSVASEVVVLGVGLEGSARLSP